MSLVMALQFVDRLSSIVVASASGGVAIVLFANVILVIVVVYVLSCLGSSCGWYLGVLF